MLSARRFPTACPQCRSQILRFYESGFTNLLPAARPQRPIRGSVANSTLPRLGARRSFARPFSSTRSVLQDTETTNSVPRPEDVIETTVRQARQTFGSTLPLDFLSEDEYKLYERLYGPPLRETRAEDVGIPFQGGSGQPFDSELPKNTLLKETESGELEAVEYSLETATDPDAVQEVSEAGAIGTFALSEAQIGYLHVKANSQREFDVLVKLQLEYEAAKLRPIEEEEDVQEEPEEEQEEEEDEGEPDATFGEWKLERETPNQRMHEFTLSGQFKTNPSTLHLPKAEFVEPISELLGRVNSTHLREAAERIFGGAGLPYSPATPESKKNLPQKPIPVLAGHHRMADIDADAYIATVLPGVYASIMSTLVEVRKRLGTSWMRDLIGRDEGKGPRVLDVGGGGAGLAAWQEILQAEWDSMKERGEVTGREPPGKRTAVIGSDNLRHRISRFLHNTTFLPRLPDYIHSVENAHKLLDAPVTPQPRKTYDVIIVSHALMPLDKQFKRRELLDNLWALLSPEGGVLIVLEKGHPRGFEAVADVRQRLLDEFIIPPVPHATPEIQAEGDRVREPGMIIAPCTNHAKCPMYHTAGLSPGRKDFCHFSQRYIRPPFLQRILGASHRNHEDINFSFLAMQRGSLPPTPAPPTSAFDSMTAPGQAPTPIGPLTQGAEAADLAFAGFGTPEPSKKASSPPPAAPATAPHPLSLPRNILPPLKRRGHVTLDVCTPAGVLERWTVPRSFDKQAYHDARKAQWGDLWALGAKTRVRREPRLGRNRGGTEDAVVDKGDGGVRAREARRGAKRSKPAVVELNMDPRKGFVGAQEKYPGGRVPVERRTKGGRKVKIADLLQGMEGVEEDDDIDEDIRELQRKG